MCAAIGISGATMTELHKGRTKSLSTPTVKKIADYFGVPVMYFATSGIDSIRFPPKYSVSCSRLSR